VPYRVTPRGAERRAVMRARLLAAARALFATQGYAATTTRQVVHEAGTSMGNLYFYFPDKEALLRALVEEATADVARAIDAAIARVPPGAAQLAVAVATSVTALTAHADLARLVFVEAAHVGLRPVVMAQFAARVRAFLAAHPTLLRGVPADLVAAAWQGAIFAVLEEALAQGTPPDAVALGRFLARWNLQALGLPPPLVEEALRALDDDGHDYV